MNAVQKVIGTPMILLVGAAVCLYAVTIGFLMAVGVPTIGACDGVYVQKVFSDYPASKAGLIAGDQILVLNDIDLESIWKDVDSVDELAVLLRDWSKGQRYIDAVLEDAKKSDDKQHFIAKEVSWLRCDFASRLIRENDLSTVAMQIKRLDRKLNFEVPVGKNRVLGVQLFPCSILKKHDAASANRFVLRMVQGQMRRLESIWTLWSR